MPRDLRHFFVITVENRVVAYATNLRAFVSEVKLIAPIESQIVSESTYQRYFKQNTIKEYVGSDGKVYTLQKVV